MNSIFISSSFKDMQHERDVIRYKTLPQINDYLRNNYGQETTVIDLRWGINTSEADEFISMSKIVRTCLFEIDNCKPFMIVLLGDRYGTIIKKEQFVKHQSNFRFDNVDDIGVTELEIRYAMHLADQDKMHVFFYFRDMDYSTVKAIDKENIYFDIDESQDKRHRLDILKKDILTDYPQQCRTYKSAYDYQSGKLTGLDHLSDLIFEDIKSCVLMELGTPNQSPLCVDDAFIKSKQASFVGRNYELAEIENFITSDYYNVALLQGNAGVGKSAIIANIPLILKNKNREFLSVFCGQGNSSDSALGIMRNIVYRLRNLLKITTSNIEDENLWDIEQWHREMDLLVEKFVDSENKQLIVLIDAVDQMIQDVFTKKMYYIPSLYSGKVKVLLSAITEYQVEKSLPLLEKMKLIKIKEPSSEDIYNAVDEIWHKYGKPSVSKEIKNKLFEKQLSNNYLYINLLLNRLTYIGLDMFGNENNSEQFIIENIKQIIEDFPNTLEGAAQELLNVLCNYINRNLCPLLLSYLCVSSHGLRVTDIESLCGELYDAADFSYLKKLLGNFVFEREDHRYDFSHKVFRGAYNVISEEVKNKYFEHSLSLPKHDSLSIWFFVHSAICAKKYSYINEFMTSWVDTAQDAKKAAEYLAQFIESDTMLVENLISNFHITGISNKHLIFLCDYLFPFLSVSEETKRFIDGISELLFADIYEYADINDAKLKLLCDFEEKRFDFNNQYSGKKKIETNRYYLCLEELASRIPTQENQLKLENFKLDYEPYWDFFKQCYNFSIDRENIEWSISKTFKDITEKFNNPSKIDELLLSAKAYIKKADCEYAEVIVFRNEKADKLISVACDLINQAAEKAIPLSRNEKIKSMLKIAECYNLIGEIYMRVTNESGLSVEFFRHSIYEQATEFFENARSLFVTVGCKNLTNENIETFLHLLHNECKIISKGRYIKNKTVKEINETISELLEFVESNMYRVVQSQTICTQYAALCAEKANVISNEIPALGHISERDLYPWSTVYTKAENYQLYDTLKRMDYWCDKSVFLCKYLFSVNPSPKNIEGLIFSARSRINILNYYEYRSLESIDKAETKKVGYLTEIDVSKEDIEKDRQYQEKRKIPFLISLCEALHHSNATDKNKFTGLYLIVAQKLFSLQRNFKCEPCWEPYIEEMLAIEKGVVECIEFALNDKDSFAFYLLTQSLSKFNFDEFKYNADKEYFKNIELEYSNALEEDISMFNITYSEWYFDWML